MEKVFMRKHKMRVAKAKDFVSKNKVFTILAIVIIIFLTSNFLFQTSDNTDTLYEESGDYDTQETDDLQITDNEPLEDNEWRFYFIDLIILVTVGGFCVVMIIRERKKSKGEI